MKKQAPMFRDGLVSIYRTVNVAPPGETPIERLEKKITLRYDRKTIGVHRAYLAQQAGARVDLLLRVPFQNMASAQDVAIPTEDGHQYFIDLVQVPEGIIPPVMDLTLVRLTPDQELKPKEGA